MFKPSELEIFSMFLVVGCMVYTLMLVIFVKSLNSRLQVLRDKLKMLKEAMGRFDKKLEEVEEDECN